MRREVLTWSDIDQLIDHLLPQLKGEFEVMVMITRGGIVPGGLIAEATQISDIFTNFCSFPETRCCWEKGSWWSTMSGGLGGPSPQLRIKFRLPGVIPLPA